MTTDTCHCGADMRGSDHCWCCFCEYPEAACDHEHTAECEDDWTAQDQ